jgi:hypothetical protein
MKIKTSVISKEQLLGTIFLHALLLEVEVAGKEGVLLVEHVLELVVEVALQTHLVFLRLLGDLSKGVLFDLHFYLIFHISWRMIVEKELTLC